MYKPHTQAPVRVPPSPSTPSLHKRLWVVIGLMLALILINRLAEENGLWLWGGGIVAGSLTGLFYAKAARQPDLKVEVLVWIVTALLGIVLISVVPDKILFTLLKVAIFSLLVTGRRRNAESNQKND